MKNKEINNIIKENEKKGTFNYKETKLNNIEEEKDIIELKGNGGNKRLIKLAIIVCLIIIISIIYIYINRVRVIGKKDGYSISKKRLIIKKSGKYTIFGSKRNFNIIIKTKDVTLYFQKINFNSKTHHTILIDENCVNTQIYLNNSILSNNKNYPIFKIRKQSSLILKAENSFFKGKIFLYGENDNNLIINGIFKLSKNNNYISINEKFKIEGDFTFNCESKEIFSKELYINYYPKFYIPERNYFDIFKLKSLEKSTRIFENKLKCKIESLDNIFLYFKEKIYVTMTSWKERINEAYKSLEILINNSFRPNKVILNLAIEEFPKKNLELPENLLDLLKYDNFEIYWVEKNDKVFKKLIPTLNRYKEDIIITTDDDVLYPYDMIEIILKEFKRKGENNPMSFGGYQTDWNINNTYIHSHYGASSIVKYKFYNEKMEELYNETTVKGEKFHIKCYDDAMYTYAALLNGYLYYRSSWYSIRNHVLNSPQLNQPFSEFGDYNWQQVLLHHAFVRYYIYDKYNLTIEEIIKKIK